jgi:thiamine biosynthesis lipoprotein
VAALREWGIRRGLVNVGGDLYALGTSEDGDPWMVGIRSPDDPRALSGKIAVADAAVATSGDYLRAFRHGGRVYHHLLDPATGAPRQTAVHSVTVRGPTCLAADAAATAVFGLPAREANALLSRSGAGLEVV